MKYFCLIILFITSCKNVDKQKSNNNNFIFEDFLSFYDNYISNKINGDMSIDKKYIKLIEDNLSKIKIDGSLSEFIPDSINRMSFFKTTNQELLSEIYIIKDTTYMFNQKGEKEKVYHPYSFTLNMNGKFFNMIKNKTPLNPFYKSFYDNLNICGDFCPSSFTDILYKYKEIDFKNKEDRLIFAATMLSMN